MGSTGRTSCRLLLIYQIGMVTAMHSEFFSADVSSWMVFLVTSCICLSNISVSTSVRDLAAYNLHTFQEVKLVWISALYCKNTKASVGRLTYGFLEQGVQGR